MAQNASLVSFPSHPTSPILPHRQIRFEVMTPPPHETEQLLNGENSLHDGQHSEIANEQF